MTTEQEYVLGTDAEELTRLGIQHRLWSDRAVDLWRRGGLRVGSRMLDIGCGPGYASLDAAQLIGTDGAVFGVDMSGRFIDEAARRARDLGLPWAEFVEGNVQELASVCADRRFDLAYARWVLCFCPDPGAVIAGAAEVLEPGGSILIQDYYNYHAMTTGPRIDAVQRYVDAIKRQWRDNGGNPDVMGDVPGLLAEHGFEVVHHAVYQKVARPTDQIWAWPETWIASSLHRLIDSGHLEEADAEAMRDWFRAAPSVPGRFYMPPPVHEIHAVKR
ncbi:MAG: class I SAM-dependent methyltransferase [Planctomycetota bacterium]